MTVADVGNLYALGNAALTIITLAVFAVALVVALRLRPANTGAWVLAGAFLLDLLCSVGLVVINLVENVSADWTSTREILQVVVLAGELVAGLGLVLGLALLATPRKPPVQREVSHV